MGVLLCFFVFFVFLLEGKSGTFKISTFMNNNLLRPSYGIISLTNKSESQCRDADKEQAL